jgi:hypothetical protein
MKYSLSVTLTRIGKMTIEADSQEEAEEKAAKRFDEYIGEEDYESWQPRNVIEGDMQDGLTYPELKSWRTR